MEISVYVLFFFDTMVGIYSTKEKAEAYISGSWYPEDYRISEWVVDKGEKK